MRPGPRRMPQRAPRTTWGAWLMDSAPPQSTASVSPRRISCAPWVMASNPEPQRDRLTVTAGTSIGSPDSEPGCGGRSRWRPRRSGGALPNTTCPMSAGRRVRCERGRPWRRRRRGSMAVRSRREPPKVPYPVRTPERKTTSFVAPWVFSESGTPSSGVSAEDNYPPAIAPMTRKGLVATRGHRTSGRRVSSELSCERSCPAGVEPDQGAPACSVMKSPDGASGARDTPVFQRVENGAGRHRRGHVEGDFAVQVREDAEAHRQLDSDHGNVCTSTDRTAGRSRTMGAHVSPPLARTHTPDRPWCSK